MHRSVFVNHAMRAVFSYIYLKKIVVINLTRVPHNTGTLKPEQIGLILLCVFLNENCRV